MKRLALAILTAAAVTDLANDPHTHILLGDMLNLKPDQSALSLLLASPVISKIEYWGISLLALSLVSLLLSRRKPSGPDIIGR